MKRFPELDLTKSFVLLVGMIGIHTMYDLADLEQSIPERILNALATAWAAPVFMFCMGLTLVFSRRQNCLDYFRRGFLLITIGMALNVLRYGPMAFTAHAANHPELMKGLALIYCVDILQFAGLALMFFALCKKLKMGIWSILGLSLLMNIVGTLLIGSDTPSYVLNQILGYFYHTQTCSCFPLLNWFIFVAAGNLMGNIYKREGSNLTIYRRILPVCGVVAAIHQYLSVTGQNNLFKTLENDWEYYSMATPDALCIAFGVAPAMLGIFWLIAKIVPEKWMGVLGYPSRHINQFYCVSWVCIMWTACFLYFIEPAKTFGAFVPRWIAIVVATTIIVVFYNNLLKQRIGAFFSNYKKAWCIAVWLFIVGFGIWYFTSIPGPYMMPY